MTGPLTVEELSIMRKAGKVAAKILKKLNFFLKPGISTKSIEKFYEEELSNYQGMEPAFRGFMGYPASLCVSVNEEVIHGIPSERVINSGDLVSVDLGIKYRGLFVDTAYTYLIGKTSSLAKKLIKVSLKSLYEGISRIKPGRHVGDISASIQKVVEKNGFSVIRRFVGHGIGKSLHLPPEVPNFGQESQGPELLAGYVLAIEPMVSAGSFEVEISANGWTARTKDASLAAHFEHTVAITKRGPWVLTR